MERRSGMPILDPKERATTGAGFLAMPLRAQQRVCGALFLTREGEGFTARELRLLRIYCNQAAVAIENAIVYERVENLVATDGLTSLFNRRYLEGALERELARADRSSSSLALLLLDIDHFKSFNDTYGHAMGDLVLKKVATTLPAVLASGRRSGAFRGRGVRRAVATSGCARRHGVGRTHPGGTRALRHPSGRTPATSDREHWSRDVSRPRRLVRVLVARCRRGVVPGERRGSQSCRRR